MNSHSSFMKESVESHIASSDRSGIRLKSYVFSISKPIFFPPYYVALIITYVCVCSFTHSCLTLCDPTRLLCPWDFLGKNTGVGSHSLLQGILPNQVSCLAGRFTAEPLGKPPDPPALALTPWPTSFLPLPIAL